MKPQFYGNWMDGLSNRIQTVLMNWNVESRDKALELVQSKQILKARNFGWKCFEELSLWLGLPKPVMPRYNPRRKYCPHCKKRIKGKLIFRK